MIRRLVSTLILAPLGIVIVALAVANRNAVTVSFDPFNPAEPAFVLTMPLFVLVFALVMFGVVIGGIAAWLRQGKARRRARQLDWDLRQARAEAAELRRQLADHEPPSSGAALLLRPPAA
jgi:uncharacterized integral membrane protein